jgi:hypothetical protein
MSSSFTGTMKGTITNVSTGAEKEFLSTGVGRHNLDGHLNVWGDQSSPWETIAFALNHENAPSKEYKVGDGEVVRLLYIVQPFGPVVTAVSGTINLQNHSPKQSINGVLAFDGYLPSSEKIHVRAVFAIDDTDSA